MTELDAVVAGDAAITFAWQVSVPPSPGRTSKLLGAVEPEGRFGGCAPGVALALAELGHRVALVSWLGDDGYGRAYLDRLRAAGVDVGGVEVAAGQSSARALMLYDGNGSATCLHHPSGSASLGLPAAGRNRLDQAPWLVLTAGPAGMTRALLDARPQTTSVAWNVKGDPSHYPIPLRRRIIDEARLLCFNRDELAFLAEALDVSEDATAEEQVNALHRATGAVLVMTDGRAGCRVIWPEGDAVIPATAIEVDDPTGVGDAFFAAFISATIRGQSPPQAARAATTYASTFLKRRSVTAATTQLRRDIS
jgi:sugar/nucleoside kinase (ribokinase family)